MSAWVVSDSNGAGPGAITKDGVAVAGMVSFEVHYQYHAAAEAIDPTSFAGERFEIWITVAPTADLNTVMNQPGLSGFSAAGAGVQPPRRRYLASKTGDTLAFSTFLPTATSLSGISNP